MGSRSANGNVIACSSSNSSSKTKTFQAIKSKRKRESERARQRYSLLRSARKQKKKKNIASLFPQPVRLKTVRKYALVWSGVIAGRACVNGWCFLGSGNYFPGIAARCKCTPTASNYKPGKRGLSALKNKIKRTKEDSVRLPFARDMNPKMSDALAFRLCKRGGVSV